MNDYPTLEDAAIGDICAALNRKIEAMVRDGFDVWEGTIRSGGYVLDVDLTMTIRPPERSP